MGGGSPSTPVNDTPLYKCRIFGGQMTKRFLTKRGSVEFMGLTLKTTFFDTIGLH